jgi:HEPN domain-containing protein
MAGRFMQQARVDLESARENVRPQRYHNAVYFSEQATEKALKAAHWHLLAEEPSWTHELESLSAKLAEGIGEVPVDVFTAIGQLAAGIEQARYPSGHVDDPIPADLVSETDAVSTIERAEQVVTWAESLLRRPSGKPRQQRNC